MGVLTPGFKNRGQLPGFSLKAGGGGAVTHNFWLKLVSNSQFLAETRELKVELESFEKHVYTSWDVYVDVCAFV